MQSVLGYFDHSHLIFLMNSSMVIRDLTLRSAASFGSFHLIRLLYDEYMFFLIEHKVADAMGKTTIDIMTEVWTGDHAYHNITIHSSPCSIQGPYLELTHLIMVRKASLMESLCVIAIELFS